MNGQAKSLSMPVADNIRVIRGGGALSVRRFPGEGPAFVLMHGFPDNQHIYDDLIPHLVAAGREVVSFDFLGFGDSDKPEGFQYSFRQQLDDLHAVVVELGLGKVVPVAHDSSGTAALNYALDHKDHVAGVVVLNAVYWNSPTIRYPEFIELFATESLKALSQAMLREPEHFAFVLQVQRAAFQRDLADDHKSRYAEFLGPLIDANFRSKPSSATAFAHMTGELFAEAARNGQRLGELEKLDVPVRLVWGQRDPYLNTGVAEDIRAHLKHVTLDFLDAGHWVQIDLAAETASRMLAAQG